MEILIKLIRSFVILTLAVLVWMAVVLVILLALAVFSGAVVGVFWLASNGQELPALFFGAGLAYMVYQCLHSYDYKTAPVKPTGKRQKVP